MTDKDRKEAKKWISKFEFRSANQDSNAEIKMTIATNRPSISLSEKIDMKSFCTRDAEWLVGEFIPLFANDLQLDCDGVEWEYGYDDHGDSAINIDAELCRVDGVEINDPH